MNGVVFTSVGRYFVPSVLALTVDFIVQKVYGSVMRKWAYIVASDGALRLSRLMARTANHKIHLPVTASPWEILTLSLIHI